MEEVSTTRMEGLAAWGLISEARVEKCRQPGKSRIRAFSKKGEELVTKCMEDDAARRVATLIRLYIKNWSRLVVAE